jgi:hypothetical protein
MEKEFVTYEQSLALKELGFNEECFGYYVITTLLITTDNVYDSKEIPVIKAPLKQQLFRWFREMYSSQCDIWQYEDDLSFAFSVKINFKRIDAEIGFNTYEKAENACIDKLIEITKQKDNGK